VRSGIYQPSAGGVAFDDVLAATLALAVKPAGSFMIDEGLIIAVFHTLTEQRPDPRVTATLTATQPTRPALSRPRTDRPPPFPISKRPHATARAAGPSSVG